MLLLTARINLSRSSTISLRSPLERRTPKPADNKAVLDKHLPVPSRNDHRNFNPQPAVGGALPVGAARPLTFSYKMDLPTFKYHPEPVATGSVVLSQNECECCGKVREYIYHSSEKCPPPIILRRWIEPLPSGHPSARVRGMNRPQITKESIRLSSWVGLFSLGLLLFVSCQTSLPPYPGPSALESGHWTKAQSDPPIYLPKGMPKNHPRGFHDGFWILAGDPHDSRFFVPMEGYEELTRTELEAEAKAAIHSDELERRGRKKIRNEFLSALAGGLEP
jgi:hypothetical protein